MTTVVRRETGPVVLYVDDSDESRRVRQDLERRGVRFRVVYGSSSRKVPAIEGSYGMVAGYENIRRYLLSSA